MKQYKIVFALFFIIIFSVFLSGIEKKKVEKTIDLPTFEIQNYTFNISEVELQFNQALEDNLCGFIHLNKGTKLYNISGYSLSQTFPGSKVFMTPAKSTDFKTAQQVAEECYVFWEETISGNQTFSFSFIPPGKYVLFVKGSSYPEYRGPPLPYEGNSQGFKINVSFHGGNSKYMMSAFEITSIS